MNWSKDDFITWLETMQLCDVISIKNTPDFNPLSIWRLRCDEYVTVYATRYYNDDSSNWSPLPLWARSFLRGIWRLRHVTVAQCMEVVRET
jgi:hypothetical protein